MPKGDDKAVKEPTVFFGAWAALKAKSLREKNPHLYWNLIENHEIHHYLQAYQTQYELIGRQMMERLAKERGANEELFNKDIYEWVLITEEIMENVRTELTRRIMASDV